MNKTLIEFSSTKKENIFKKFITWQGNCECSENYSMIVSILEEKELSSNQIVQIYSDLKKFESLYSGFELATIRVKEALINNINTPLIILKEIAKGNLEHSYLFEYYGGYGGDDYRVNISLNAILLLKIGKKELYEIKEYRENRIKYLQRIFCKESYENVSKYLADAGCFEENFNDFEPFRDSIEAYEEQNDIKNELEEILVVESGLYEKLQRNLDWYDILMIQSLEDDHDCQDNVIKRYDCKKDNLSVTVELYVDGEVDIYYTSTDETIYAGQLKK